MNSIIEQIKSGERLDEIIAQVKSSLFSLGPVNTTVLEEISYIKLFQPEFFSLHENEIVETMGLFYKKITPNTLNGTIFEIYHKYIKDKFGEDYTPIQAKMLSQINRCKFLSFSAPTSTGKSYVFRDLIKSSLHDVVVIVPSRALINEYYDRISELVNIKEVNVLSFVEHINTKHSKRNIFILTPERARELFKCKEWLNIDLFLFDEAQLSDENSVRGLYFDSIVRRALTSFPNSKYVFAHPFISNPQAQLLKNNIADEDSYSMNYQQRNVGQIFYVYDSNKKKYYHISSMPSLLGNKRIEASFDPIENAIRNNGSVLIYVPKSHIYDKSIFTQFKRYIDLCLPIQNDEATAMIEDLRYYIGALNKDKHYYNSEMLEHLKCGIVIHHGSMPLTARLILEHFTQKGYCKICFATSTLEQGINMPFDVVYLDRFEGSKSLSVKNLIGRAGRSTVKNKFDYGSVIVRKNAVNSLRKVIAKDDTLSECSKLDNDSILVDKKYQEFKEAIKNGTYSDEYNLTENDLETLKSEDIQTIIPTLLDMLFEENGTLSVSKKSIKAIYNDFNKLYEIYLGRDLETPEKSVLSTAVKIMIWRIEGKTFSTICKLRYDYVAKVKERKTLTNEGLVEKAENLVAKFTIGCHDIPDKTLNNYPLFKVNTKAQDVDYDLIVYDTYDYLDKIIGFKLSDIFYAIFILYYKTTQEAKALQLANLIKFGTDNNKHIWMLRYGLTFEDIEWVDKCIDSVDEKEIVFNSSVLELSEKQHKVIEPFLYDSLLT